MQRQVPNARAWHMPSRHLRRQIDRQTHGHTPGRKTKKRNGECLHLRQPLSYSTVQYSTVQYSTVQYSSYFYFMILPPLYPPYFIHNPPPANQSFTPCLAAGWSSDMFYIGPSMQIHFIWFASCHATFGFSHYAPLLPYGLRADWFILYARWERRKRKCGVIVIDPETLIDRLRIDENQDGTNFQSMPEREKVRVKPGRMCDM